MGYVFQPQHNKQAIHGPGDIFILCGERAEEEPGDGGMNARQSRSAPFKRMRHSSRSSAGLVMFCVSTVACYIQAETNNFMKLLMLR